MVKQHPLKIEGAVFLLSLFACGTVHQMSPKNVVADEKKFIFLSKIRTTLTMLEWSSYLC
ncbi:hypothetical protein CHI02_07285 [Niallia circulans]|nr:hypothetical protein CHI02_07285 [Niallia circulans]